MSALPRPDLAPGPKKSLNDALHDLHHRAGWPSLRSLAKGAGVSHTTVSKVFSAPALPTWGNLELLVEAMDGDAAVFHDLWLAASTPTNGMPVPAPRIAGRRVELETVRRHLETGTGLLLVTGEAGIGKTTLVEAARASVRGAVCVAVGRCLPLSAEIPLMPFTEALRQVGREQDGRLMAEALRGCADYVLPALATLLPELSATEGRHDPDDRWLRQRLFSAVAELLQVLAASGPSALVLEDLHWADDLTLDLVEHLSRGTRTAILATWRTDDADVPTERRDWCTRVRRDAASLRLGPLTNEETVEQLALLRPGTSRKAAALIHSRSRGQPLFSEQLAQEDAGEPAYLNDLLDGRVAHLEGDPWLVASLLGVADRPLHETAVASSLGIEPRELSPTLRKLRDLQLLGITDGAVHLRHPLLAEAVRRRLLPGEAMRLHRALAQVLAAAPGAEPAEVARHWQGAADAPEELAWRVRAARAAAERFAAAQAADHWLRARELWPQGSREIGDEPIRRHEVAAGIASQLDLAGRPAEAVPVLEAELTVPDLYDVAERADLIRTLARFNSSQFRAGDHGLRMVERAIELYRSLPPSAGLAAALNWRGTELEWHGRRDEAAAALDEAIEVAALVGDKLIERSVRAQRAWQMAVSGDARAVGTIEGVVDSFGHGENLSRDLAVAVRHTDILLMTCGSAEAIAAAARPALELAERWDVASAHVHVIRCNVSQGWRRAGHLRRALDVLSDHTVDEEPGTFPLIHVERAALDVLCGQEESARRRLSHLETGRHQAIDPFVAEAVLLHGVWLGDPGAAWRMCGAILGARDDEIAPGTVGDLLALAARAAVDMSSRSSPPARQATMRSLLELRARLHHDPFESSAVLADRAASPLWLAELARLRGDDSVQGWLQAAETWDELCRPHDAAYGRWRAAQVALRDGRGTLAARLLRRAATDAREHVPLTSAIASTAAGLP